MNDPPELNDKKCKKEPIDGCSSAGGGAGSDHTSTSKNSSKRRPRLIPIVTTPRRGLSGASSSDDENLDDDGDDDHDVGETRMPSFHNSQGTPVIRQESDGASSRDASTSSPTSSAASTAANAAGTSVSADQERQILLLMLLAQVCALHDPTPRTFTVHVLELFERGILGRQSIHFLFELGLVPANTPRLLPPSTTAMDDSKEEVLDLATVPATAAPSSPQTIRAQEASAIRTHLELHDLAQQQQQDVSANLFQAYNNTQSTLVESPQTATKPNPWRVENHPLSLSRYQREFHEVRLLNAGAFGEVFLSTNKIDLKDYAVKRVAFSASGYSKDSVSQVIREVHCLAQCDHQNVVRYYTSWLEPSWMTGSGATTMTSLTSTAEVRRQQKLLTDIQNMMVSGAADPSSSQSPFTPSVSTSENDNFRDFFQDDSATPRNRKFSIGSSMDSHSFDSAGNSYDETSSSEEEQEEWSMGETTNREDSVLFASSHPKGEVWEPSSSPPRQDHGGPKKKADAAARIKYRYQICLFIQMQLCHPATLGDWIRHRNAQCPDPNQGRAEHFENAAKIFSQIVGGLAHIHKKNIVHRDLKPHNLFRSLEEDGVFLIGDFGLSKLIHSATHQQSTKKKKDSPIFSSTDSGTALVCHQAPIELTEGVGTASYAAPEQVTTRTYGKRADIFSLGLILLELMCCFTTEHERMQTFYDCRHRRDIPLWITEEYPTSAKVILDCTDPNPSRRPTAEELLAIDLLCSSPTGVNNNEVDSLKVELEEKTEQIFAYELQLREKDLAIARLQQALAQCRCHQGGGVTAGPPQTIAPPDDAADADCVNLASAEVQSSSSSSEDGL